MVIGFKGGLSIKFPLISCNHLHSNI